MNLATTNEIASTSGKDNEGAVRGYRKVRLLVRFGASIAS